MSDIAISEPAAFAVGFVLFPNLTQLDLTGPWEVLTRLPGARCDLLSHDLQPVRSASGGLTILPTRRYDETAQLDLICVPGGPGHLEAMQDQALIAFLRAQAPGCRFITSVCTGALVLAAAGLLHGYQATTHWLSLDRLSAFGVTPVKQRVVFDRNRVTGGGVTAGIDFALALAAEIAGEAKAREIQLQIEYDPEPPFAAADEETIVQMRTKLSAYRRGMDKVDRKIIESN